MWVRSLILSLTLLLGFSAQAEEVDGNPYRLMSYVAEQTFSRLAKIDREADDAQQQLEAIVRQQLMPHIDYRYAAFVVLGKHIKKTSKQQREDFAEAFQEYLVSTYTQALGQYKQQQVVIEPERAVGEQTKLGVRAQFIDGERPPINLEFKFRKLKNKDANSAEHWLAYDLIAEGVSLLSTKQSEMDSLIRANGIDGVIQILRDKNLATQE
ncbi:MlaC/ttg2D family ABC transporter substrate-binding protein [Agarivorans gilvus]|jgi:phospholipid transport system substrate-binding protein|uniref:Organic solvent ABC transporter substrate-binding protein n=1 Tax=Agarivorans gilvus TaxID=680279 RepID=A0ABQ1HZ12_9ALTE|nr:ABC transporter substrate-binding protein [Agarivorans gilvus]GGA96357.1 organic solvent ABC transporter substrate-binding protein [Agarivorans gilvus]